MTTFAIISLVCASIPSLLYLRNRFLFRAPPAFDASLKASAVSILIPARNEEASILAALEHVIASRGVDWECIVLDDHSEDRTAEIVRDIQRKHPQVRLETAPALPHGWSGKQHACYVLSQHARHPLLVFLDADVRLSPDAIHRIVRFQEQSQVALVSGFPRQETGTFLERLLIPMMHFLLLGYLPMDWMRRWRFSCFSAGCGQWFLTTREAYDVVGGHANLLVRASFHDGMKLPRAYRAKGFQTDICDATELASCRMYRNAGQVWNGLTKNAIEGLGAPRLLWFMTLLLFCGQVAPFVLLAQIHTLSAWDAGMVLLACLCVYLPRIDATIRFRQSWLGALLHPVGVVILLCIQWNAAIRAVIGKPVGWKGRPLPA